MVAWVGRLKMTPTMRVVETAEAGTSARAQGTDEARGAQEEEVTACESLLSLAGALGGSTGAVRDESVG